MFRATSAAFMLMAMKVSAIKLAEDAELERILAQVEQTSDDRSSVTCTFYS